MNYYNNNDKDLTETKDAYLLFQMRFDCNDFIKRKIGSQIIQKKNVLNRNNQIKYLKRRKEMKWNKSNTKLSRWKKKKEVVRENNEKNRKSKTKTEQELIKKKQEQTKNQKWEKEVKIRIELKKN